MKLLCGNREWIERMKTIHACMNGYKTQEISRTKQKSNFTKFTADLFMFALHIVVKQSNKQIRLKIV